MKKKTLLIVGVLLILVIGITGVATGINNGIIKIDFEKNNMLLMPFENPKQGVDDMPIIDPDNEKPEQGVDDMPIIHPPIIITDVYLDLKSILLKKPPIQGIDDMPIINPDDIIIIDPPESIEIPPPEAIEMPLPPIYLN